MKGSPLDRPARALVYADSASYSGAESFFCEVVEDLSKGTDFELVLAAPPSNSELLSRLEEAAQEGVSFPVPAQDPFLAGLTLPFTAHRVNRALNGVEVDVALINLPSAEYGSSPLLAGRLAGTPSVGLLHVACSLKDAGFRLGGLREIAAGRALRHLEHVAVLSEAAEVGVREDWGLGETSVSRVRMPRPATLRLPRDQARRELGLESTSCLVGIAGRVSFKQKGQDTFVGAAQILAREEPDIRFVVAGDGPDGDRLAQMIDEAGLEERFHLLGQVEEIGVFLSAIDLIAIPSRFEGLPLVALEALQAGIPGVASGVDGLLDVWPSDWLVPPSDPGSLAERVLSILGSDSPRTAQLITEGRRLAARRETEHPGEDVAGLLREVIGDVDQR